MIAHGRAISMEDTSNGFNNSERLKNGMEGPVEEIEFAQSNLRHSIRLAIDQTTIDLKNDE
jgi:hypothetical protein